MESSSQDDFIIGNYKDEKKKEHQENIKRIEKNLAELRNDTTKDGIAKIENYQKVDNEYIGIPLSKGIHSIVIKRNNRYFLITCFFSYLGLAFMFFIKYLENKRRFT